MIDCKQRNKPTFSTNWTNEMSWLQIANKIICEDLPSQTWSVCKNPNNLNCNDWSQGLAHPPRPPTIATHTKTDNWKTNQKTTFYKQTRISKWNQTQHTTSTQKNKTSQRLIDMLFHTSHDDVAPNLVMKYVLRTSSKARVFQWTAIAWRRKPLQKKPCTNFKIQETS